MNKKLFYTTYLTYFRTIATDEELAILTDECILNFTIGDKVHSMSYGEVKKKSQKEIEKYNANYK